MGKGEIAHYKQSLLFPQCFQKACFPGASKGVIVKPPFYILQNVLIVDVDKKSFIRSQGDESTLLPGKMTKALKTSLNMCRVDSGKLT